MDNRSRMLASACAAALMTFGTAATAQTTATPPNAAVNRADTRPAVQDRRDEAKDAIKHAREAANVLSRMQQVPQMNAALQHARGVFVVPEFGKIAWGVGGRAGTGVLMLNRNGQWTNPAFYDFGGLSIGVQGGAEGGSFALILNSEKAVQQFMQQNNWTLDANAGLTVVEWSKKAQASTSAPDVIIWSASKGLFAGASIGVTDIRFDREETAAFYGKAVTASEAFTTAPTHNAEVIALKSSLDGSNAPRAADRAGTPRAGANAAAMPNAAPAPEGRDAGRR